MDNGATNEKDKDELLADLQVYQLELEMQNEQLNASYDQLQNERSKFAGFFDLAPVGYFVLDHLGIVKEANHTGTDLFGMSKETMLLQPFKLFLDPESIDIYYAFLQRMQVATGKQNCEVKAFELQLNLMYLRLEGRVVESAIDSSHQYYITAIDITANKLAQQRLMSTSQRLEMTLQASGTGTWTMEVPSKKIVIDDFCYSILEIKLEDFNGSIKHFLKLIYPDDLKSVKQALKKSIYNFDSFNFEFRIITKDNSIKNISVLGHQVSKVSEQYFAGIIIDITAKKRLDKEASELRHEKQRLILSATFNAQEKERFRISNALHDSVCQILYGIRLNLQGIQISSDKKKELNNASMLLDEAIRETRDISYELTPSVLRDFGFNAGIKEMAQRLSSKNMKIYSRVDSTAEALHKEVQLYLFRITQELINNCLNHAKASEARIVVTTEGDSVLLSVSDNGIGFGDGSEQALNKGSGLRAIKNRIFLLGGIMNLETSDKGTVISLSFKSNQTPLLNE